MNHCNSPTDEGGRLKHIQQIKRLGIKVSGRSLTREDKLTEKRPCPSRLVTTPMHFQCITQSVL